MAKIKQREHDHTGSGRTAGVLDVAGGRNKQREHNHTGSDQVADDLEATRARLDFLNLLVAHVYPPSPKSAACSP